MNVLLLAYQISPSRGSEYAVGWNFAMELARHHTVHLLCGASGDHMGDTEEILAYFAKYPHENIKVHAVQPTPFASFLNSFNKRGLTPAFYLAFRLWHKSALATAKKIASENVIDVIHQLGPIGFREPGFLWTLGLPFVWGPVGGALFVNDELLRHTSAKTRIYYKVKNAITRVQLMFGRRVRAALEKSEIAFASSENKINFEKFFGRSGSIMPEQAILTEVLPDRTSFNENSPIQLFWAGRMVRQKNLKMLLTVLAAVPREASWELNLIGDGPELKELQILSEQLEIVDRLKWHGRKSREETLQCFVNSDLHVMTSLCEGNPAVVFEALSLGIPTISLAVGGMADVLKEGGGILIPVTDYDETVDSFADTLYQIVVDRSRLRELQQQCKRVSSTYTWPAKISFFEKLYHIAIDRSKKHSSADVLEVG